jgi:hypothetical protein
MRRVTRFALVPLFGLLASLLPAAETQDLKLTGATPSTTGQSLAFARYIASLGESDPFTEAPVLVTIEAWSPTLHQESKVRLLRHRGESGVSEYLVLAAEGETATARHMILPYIEEQEHLDRVPSSSTAISPANYKFHYLGMVETENAAAYTFRITPKRKGDGLIQGQLWIDSQTGVAVAQTGVLVKKPDANTRRVEISQDTKFVQESPALRITHVIMETRQAGRGLLTITEQCLTDEPDRDGAPQELETTLRVRVVWERWADGFQRK